MLQIKLLIAITLIPTCLSQITLKETILNATIKVAKDLVNSNMNCAELLNNARKSLEKKHVKEMYELTISILMYISNDYAKIFGEIKRVHLVYTICNKEVYFTKNRYLKKEHAAKSFNNLIKFIIEIAKEIKNFIKDKIKYTNFAEKYTEKKTKIKSQDIFNIYNKEGDNTNNHNKQLEESYKKITKTQFIEEIQKGKAIG